MVYLLINQVTNGKEEKNMSISSSGRIRIKGLVESKTNNSPNLKGAPIINKCQLATASFWVIAVLFEFVTA